MAGYRKFVAAIVAAFVAVSTPSAAGGQSGEPDPAPLTPRAVVGRLVPLPFGNAPEINDEGLTAGVRWRQVDGGSSQEAAVVYDTQTGQETVLPDTPDGLPEGGYQEPWAVPNSGLVLLEDYQPSDVGYRRVGIVYDTADGSFAPVRIPGGEYLGLARTINSSGWVAGVRDDASWIQGHVLFNVRTRETIQLRGLIDDEVSVVAAGAISDSGWVAGDLYEGDNWTTGDQRLSSPTSRKFFPVPSTCFAVYMETQEFFRVPALPGETYCSVTDVTDDGLVLGVTTPDDERGPWTTFLYDHQTGTRTTISAGSVTVSASGINNDGVIAGTVSPPPTGRPIAAVWSPGSYSSPRLLGVLPGHSASYAADINDEGTVLTNHQFTPGSPRWDAALFTLPDPEEDRNFVRSAYRDFLGRDATDDEVAAVDTMLDRGVSRRQILTSLATSDEWIRTIVTDLYQDTLGRNPDQPGLTFWTGRLRAGLPVARAAASFYASDEYYAGIGEGDMPTWVADLYTKILDRTADTAGADFWAARARRSGRTRVALEFYQSIESRRTRVTGLYQHLLNRNPDLGGRDYWAGRVYQEGDIALAVELAASSEYYDRAQPS